MAWKLLSMARNNIMSSTKLGDDNLCRVSHVNTFCEILNDLHGLMALNGHSGAPDCILIPSYGKMDPTIGFLMI